MPKSNPQSRYKAVTLAYNARAELIILSLCLLFLTQIGDSNEPVFDVVGPNLIPLIVIGAISVLAILEIGRTIVNFQIEPETPPIAGARIPAGLFIVATLVYVALLANSILSYAFVTAVYFAVCSLIIVREITWKEVVIAIIAGLLLSFSLQYLFTEIFTIDLPT